jgi:hypothetical protein
LQCSTVAQDFFLILVLLFLAQYSFNSASFSFALFDLTNLSKMSKRKAAAISNSVTSVAEPLPKRAKVMAIKAAVDDEAKKGLPRPEMVDEPAAPQIESKAENKQMQLDDDSGNGSEKTSAAATSNPETSLAEPLPKPVKTTETKASGKEAKPDPDPITLSCSAMPADSEQMSRWLIGKGGCSSDRTDPWVLHIICLGMELRSHQGDRVRLLREQCSEEGQVRVVLLYYGLDAEAGKIDEKVGTAYLLKYKKEMYIKTSMSGEAGCRPGYLDMIVVKYLERHGFVTQPKHETVTNATNKTYYTLLKENALASEEDAGPPEAKEKTKKTTGTKDSKDTKETKEPKKAETKTKETAEMVETEKATEIKSQTLVNEQKLEADIENLIKRTLEDAVQGLIKRTFEDNIEGLIKRKCKDYIKGLIKRTLDDAIQGLIERTLDDDTKGLIKRMLKDDIKGLSLIQRPVEDAMKGLSSHPLLDDIEDPSKRMGITSKNPWIFHTTFLCLELFRHKGNCVRILRQECSEDGQVRVVLLYFGLDAEADEIDEKVGTDYLRKYMKDIYFETRKDGMACCSQERFDMIVLQYLERHGYVKRTQHATFTDATHKAYYELLKENALASDEDDGPPEAKEKTTTTAGTKDTKETKEPKKAETKAKETKETAEMVEAEKAKKAKKTKKVKENEKTTTIKQATMKVVETEKVLEGKRQLTPEEDLLP